MQDSDRVIAILLAGGTGTRLGLGYNKVFAEIGEKTILQRVFEAFARNDHIDAIVLAAGNPAAGSAEQDIAKAHAQLAVYNTGKLHAIVAGGNTRSESVEQCIECISPRDDDVVLIHDCGRPFVAQELISDVIDAALQYGASVCGAIPNDTIQLVSDQGFVTTLTNRNTVRAIATPFAGRWHIVKAARKQARDQGYFETPGYEDSCYVAQAGGVVKVVESDESNFKITSAVDLLRARALLHVNQDQNSNEDWTG